MAVVEFKWFLHIFKACISTCNISLAASPAGMDSENNTRSSHQACTSHIVACTLLSYVDIFFRPSVKIHINYTQICVKDSREKQMHTLPSEIIYQGLCKLNVYHNTILEGRQFLFKFGPRSAVLLY